jgi:hypothetical protein
MTQLTDEQVRARIAAMTMQERQKLIDDFRRVGQIEIADHLQQLLDEAKALTQLIREHLREKEEGRQNGQPFARNPMRR